MTLKCLKCRGRINSGATEKGQWAANGQWLVHTINKKVLAHWTLGQGIGGEWRKTACGLRVWVELKNKTDD